MTFTGSSYRQEVSKAEACPIKETNRKSVMGVINGSVEIHHAVIYFVTISPSCKEQMDILYGCFSTENCGISIFFK